MSAASARSSSFLSSRSTRRCCCKATKVPIRRRSRNLPGSWRDWSWKNTNTSGVQVRNATKTDPICLAILPLADVHFLMFICVSAEAYHPCQGKCGSVHRQRGTSWSIDTFSSRISASCESPSVLVLLLRPAIREWRRNCVDWLNRSLSFRCWPLSRVYRETESQWR